MSALQLAMTSGDATPAAPGGQVTDLSLLPPATPPADVKTPKTPTQQDTKLPTPVYT